MPNRPEFPPCEAFTEADVMDYVGLTLEVMPEEYEWAMSIARDPELSIELRTGILSGAWQSALETKAAQLRDS